MIKSYIIESGLSDNILLYKNIYIYNDNNSYPMYDLYNLKNGYLNIRSEKGTIIESNLAFKIDYIEQQYNNLCGDVEFTQNEFGETALFLLNNNNYIRREFTLITEHFLENNYHNYCGWTINITMSELKRLNREHKLKKILKNISERI